MHRRLLYILFVIYTYSFGQQMLTLQPGPSDGLDAYLHSGGSNGNANSNYGTHLLFAGASTTNSGQPVDIRSLLTFDLSALPSNAIISSAKLNLYGVNAPWTSNTFTHHPHGSNQSKIELINQQWDENTVTWNTQPTVSSSGSITLPATTINYENFLDIDVTDAIIGLQQGTNYGLRLSIVNTTPYHRVYFGSSDQTDPTKRPKLVIEYDTTCAPIYVTDSYTECDSFTWINGQVYYSDNNQDEVVLTTVDGCDSIIELDLTINSIDVSFQGISDLILNNPPNISIEVYQCNKEGDLLISGITQISQLSSLSPGEYSLDVTDNNTGCSNRTLCFENLPTISIQENNVENLIDIKNNTISFQSEKIHLITIQDIYGRVMLSKKQPYENITLPNNSSMLIITVHYGNKTSSFKWLQ